MSNAEPLLIRVPEAARRLGVCRSRIYDLIRDGRLPVVKIDKSTRIATAELQSFIARQTVGGDVAGPH